MESSNSTWLAPEMRASASASRIRLGHRWLHFDVAGGDQSINQSAPRTARIWVLFNNKIHHLVELWGELVARGVVYSAESQQLSSAPNPLRRRTRSL